MKSKKRPPKHFTREHQQRARSYVSSESCARNGAKGARTTIARHGPEVFFNRWREWHLKHPSRPERQVMSILDDLGVEYERDWRIGESCLSLDFYLTGRGRGIEVHGRIHQTLKAEKRAQNDVKKRALLKGLAVEALWIDDADLKDVGALKAKVRDFVMRPGKKGDH